jgi:hypothetical protein
MLYKEKNYIFTHLIFGEEHQGNWFFCSFRKFDDSFPLKDILYCTVEHVNILFKV